MPTPDRAADLYSRARRISCCLIGASVYEQDEIIAQALRDYAAERLESAAMMIAGKWPQGGAHTYTSENADRYRALEDASEVLAKEVRKMAKQERGRHEK